MKPSKGLTYNPAVFDDDTIGDDFLRGMDQRLCGPLVIFIR